MLPVGICPRPCMAGTILGAGDGRRRQVVLKVLIWRRWRDWPTCGMMSGGQRVGPCGSGGPGGVREGFQEALEKGLKEGQHVVKRQSRKEST